MTAFTFDEAAHAYYLDGVKLPSVTSIIKPIGPDFSAIPPDVLERKRALGVAVHLACELDDEGELDDDGTDPTVMRYVAAWRRFKVETAAVVLANERRLYHPTLRFAGTLDRVADLSTGPDQAREQWILDLKTGTDPHRSYGVQLAGYALLLAGGQPAPPVAVQGLRMKRGTVHLADDGTYRLHPYTDPNDEAAFRACLAIYNWSSTR